MKRNSPNYAVGLDSTLDAIRVKDYERGLEDAAKIAEGITSRTAHQSRPQYMTASTIAQAIRYLKNEHYKEERKRNEYSKHHEQ